MKRPPTPAESGRHYDALYRSSPFEDSPTFYRWVIQLAAPDAGSRVLDIGCGLGGALAAASGHDVELWGIDISREAVAAARSHVRGARVCLADGARLPFADASFDTILNLGNLEHFSDLDGGVAEMRRVLKPDGRAWILLPNLFYSGVLWRVIRTGYGPDHQQPIDRFATRSEWRDFLEAGGLAVLRSIPYHKGKWWKRLLPANLAWHFLYETQPGPQGSATALRPLGRVR